MDNNSFNNDIHLTLEELVAYSQGNLSNKEMHRLELHLIHCELCNDALDGVNIVREPVLLKNISEIKEKTATKSGINISITNKQWLAIASSISLIAVVSVIFYFLPATDNTIIAENSPLEKELAATDDEATEEVKNYEDSLNLVTLREDSLLALAIAPATQTPSTQINSSEVIEEEAKGLSVADLSNENTDLDTSEDSSLLAAVPLQATDTEELSSEEDKAIVSRSKKSAAPTAGAEAPELSEVVTLDSAEEEVSNYQAPLPERGRKAYNRYLKRSLKYPDAASENNIEGEVVLVLTINTFGSITNIDVAQSLGYGCDEEAIRLVREGPKWVAASLDNAALTDKVMVSIPFNL
jgi:TonB family protein